MQAFLLRGSSLGTGDLDESWDREAGNRMGFYRMFMCGKQGVKAVTIIYLDCLGKLGG